MFGAFKPSSSVLGGLVWKRRFRLTSTQKTRQRNRLRAVDNVIATLVKSGVNFEALTIASTQLKEHELTPKEKYFVPSKRYVGAGGWKPIHWVPKWTRVENPNRRFKDVYVHSPVYGVKQ